MVTVTVRGNDLRSPRKLGTMGSFGFNAYWCPVGGVGAGCGVEVGDHLRPTPEWKGAKAWQAEALTGRFYRTKHGRK